jgi:protocatechuate 3,4-dioxygenase beta subunit
VKFVKFVAKNLSYRRKPMTTPQPTLQPGRRRFLQATLATAITSLLTACGLGSNTQETAATTTPASAVAAQPTSTGASATATTTSTPTSTGGSGTAPAQVLQPTPACGDDDDDETPAQTEGPFYTPNTPQRTSFLEEGITGAPLLVTGAVLSTDCRPIPGALIDFWHCDANGIYDNEGYQLRGHQFAGDDGRYTLETILPGLYPGRTRHIHVKVQAPNQPVLTTQLYFPDEPDNTRDGIFHPALVMDVQNTTEGQSAAFNFVLNLS